MLKHYINRRKNRKLNSKLISNKIFCIGLHKTGTTTLANFFREYGFKDTHSVNWINDERKLNKYDFFSDGGSHFDNINEFDFRRLFNIYKHSTFILQTRETEKWVLSKLRHAGWTKDTIIQPDDPSKIKHDEWKYKSFLTIQKFIEHKINYENKVLSFFKKNDISRLLVIDITKKDIQTAELNKLKTELNLQSVNTISLPHHHNKKSQISLPKEVYSFIKKTIKEKDGTSLLLNENY